MSALQNASCYGCLVVSIAPKDVRRAKLSVTFAEVRRDLATVYDE
jgi:hypothetical protein